MHSTKSIFHATFILLKRYDKLTRALIHCCNKRGCNNVCESILRNIDRIATLVMLCDVDNRNINYALRELVFILCTG